MELVWSLSIAAVTLVIGLDGVVVGKGEVKYTPDWDGVVAGKGDVKYTPDWDGVVVGKGEVKYTPDWASLDSRPTPPWYDEAKFGIFMHWGPYAVPGFMSEWFWNMWKRDPPNEDVVNFMKDNYSPKFSYQDFGPSLTGEFFNASEWASLIGDSGAQYFIFTSKHHDGFTNFPSSRTFGWNARDIGPKRDVVGELAEAVRKDGRARFGLYYSLYEWYNPMYLKDKASGFKTRTYVEEKVWPELLQIIEDYRPEVLWSDGDWEPGVDYWGTKDFWAWLYNDSPVRETVVTNDRWGGGGQCLCLHGDFFTCADRYSPGVLQEHKWENAMTVDRESWGHRRNMLLDDILTMDELTQTLAETVSCGGNLLMNVGPSKEGTIDPIFQERMKQMGGWLAVNGEAIYSSKPWSSQNDTHNGHVWYTAKENVVYGILLEWPGNGTLDLAAPEPGADTVVTMLGFDGQLHWKGQLEDLTDRKGRHKKDSVSISIELPQKEIVNSSWAWVIKFVNLKNGGNDIW